MQDAPRPEPTMIVLFFAKVKGELHKIPLPKPKKNVQPDAEGQGGRSGLLQFIPP